MHLDFILIFSKGHNSRKGDNLDKKKACVSFFSMRNPYMKSWMDGRMHGQPETNMTRQLLRSWRHNKINSYIKEKIPVDVHVTSLRKIGVINLVVTKTSSLVTGVSWCTCQTLPDEGSWRQWAFPPYQGITWQLTTLLLHPNHAPAVYTFHTLKNVKLNVPDNKGNR